MKVTKKCSVNGIMVFRNLEQERVFAHRRRWADALLIDFPCGDPSFCISDGVILLTIPFSPFASIISSKGAANDQHDFTTAHCGHTQSTPRQLLPSTRLYIFHGG